MKTKITLTIFTFFFSILLFAQKRKDLKTVEIAGMQITKENLKQTNFRNGHAIKFVTDLEDWIALNATKTPAYCYLYFDEIDEMNAGFFYNWYAVNDKRGLAPEGFHVPNLEEMNKLLNFLSPDNCGEEIKKAYDNNVHMRRRKSKNPSSDLVWYSRNDQDSPNYNSTGLSILNILGDDLADFHELIGDAEAIKIIYQNIDNMANFWMANKNDPDKSYSWHLRDCVNENDEVQADEGGYGAFRIDSNWNKNCFFSLRLIED
jgi:uncharacterized protein (TIGR02145 family)